MQNKIDLFKQLVSTHADAMLKGDTIPYTSLNGHMYSYFSKDGFLALRLASPARDKFLEQYDTTLVIAYGIIQKEYVKVPDSLLENAAELKPWFDQSFEYVSKLKPKPGKKKGQ